jgi:hypothetical protein
MRRRGVDRGFDVGGDLALIPGRRSPTRVNMRSSAKQKS